MVRRTTKSRAIRQLRRELGALLKLCPWVLAALLLVAVFWQADLAATTGLFQSPPTDEPPAIAPTDEPPPLSSPEPSEGITTDATVEPPPTATLEPTATQEPAPTDTPSPEPTATEPGATATWTPEPGAEEGETRGRYATGEPELEFEWGMLFDSLALGLSYIWLCCGVVVLLGILAAFAAVWIASRRRRSLSE